MNFMNLPDRRESCYFTIIFMEENVTQFNKITTLVPSDKKIKHLVQFLSTAKVNPFRQFFLTNKIKEKPQFTQDKDLRQLKQECKKDKDGHYVLLCYEEKIANPQNVPQQRASAKAEAKKEDDSSCLLM